MSLSEIEKSDYDEEKVMEYFLYLTRNLEGIGGGPPSAICVGMFMESVKEGTTKKDAFELALAQLKEFTPID